MPAGPAMLAALTDADLLPDESELHRRRLGARTSSRRWSCPGPGSRNRSAAARSRSAEIFDAGIADAPADWHMLQPLWRPTCRTPQRPGRTAGSEGRPGLPVLLRHSRGRAGPRRRPRPHPDRDGSPRLGAGAGDDGGLRSSSRSSWCRPAAACRFPYNGSVARLSFGPVSYTRVRRWIRAGQFDVLHVHEPVAPSLSMLALMVADGPIVATFHTANPRSRWLTAFQGVLQPFLEKITGRIAVSELARQVQVEHLGGDAVIIPNGVDVRFFASATPLPGYPRAGGTIGFVGRFDEPRKGMARPARCAAADGAAAARRCSCWSPAAVTRRTCESSPGRSWPVRCDSSAGYPTPTRPRCCGRWTSTARRTSVARASASSSPRR